MEENLDFNIRGDNNVIQTSLMRRRSNVFLHFFFVI